MKLFWVKKKSTRIGNTTTALAAARLSEWLNRFEWLLGLGSFPVLEQLSLVQGGPLNYQPKSTWRKMSRENREGPDILILSARRNVRSLL